MVGFAGRLRMGSVTTNLLLLLLTACAADAPPVLLDAPPDGAPDAAAACNQLELPDPVVTVMQVAEVGPAPAGGALVPGTYVLTAATIYTGTGGASGPTTHTRREITTNDGTHYDLVQVDVDGATMSMNREAGSYTIAGSQLTTTKECPGGPPDTVGLTTTASSFTLIFGTDPVDVLEFTRQ